ncbi:MAG: hypothetical protein QM621_06110 [Aeromicrobium sp.]|uniref:hypothetical protein n=1 Tax=Aeromicrobium sp. TaxID=1871063 RepID=UPI0039E5551F
MTSSPHLALPPGARVARHDARRLRVGSRPGVLVDDSPGARAVLLAVDGVRDRDRVRSAAAKTSGEPVEAIDRLLDRLIDCGAVLANAPWTRLRAPADEIQAAVLRGRDPHALSGRSHASLTTHAALGCADLAELIALSARVGGVSPRPNGGPRLHVVATPGEPPRDDVDELTDTGATVLPVGLIEGRCVVGPWIVPGQTPCLRCADLTRATWEPGWTGHWPDLDRPDRPHAVGVELLQAVAAFVVSDVLAACDGRLPRTHSARFLLGPEPDQAHRSRVDLHPTCVCHAAPSPSTAEPVP